MPLSNVLSIARSALLAHQRAMSVTANNIANASTPGYTRQRLILGAQGFGAGTFGGVAERELARVRDPFLDSGFRRESGFLGTAGTMRHVLQQVEAAVNEPSDNGVAAALDSMFQAFGDLANDPTSPVHRQEVRRAAQRFTYRLRHLAESVRRSMDQAVERMRSEVGDVNSLTDKIAALNEQILAGERAGGPNPVLMDQRDQLLDELSGLIGVETVQAEDGTVTVTTEGMTLVSGSMSRNLEVRSDPEGGFVLGPEGSKQTIIPPAGSLKALHDLVQDTLPGLLERLDTFAGSVVTEVNAIHRGGTTGDGETGIDFFDPDGVSASTISISDAVEVSANAIAAGSGVDGGDNTLALEIAALAQKGVDSLEGQSFTDYYAAFAAEVGRSVRDAIDNEQAARTMVDYADGWRASVGGVSVDEEMISLIGQQEAYSAAARLVGVADQMVQEILRFVG